MLKVIGILLFATVILLIEVPPLLEKKYKKELFVFSFLFVIGVGLSIVLGLGKTIPSPVELLSIIFKPVIDVISSLWK